MNVVNIYLEGLDGAHNLKLGEYYYDADTHSMYVGVGDTESGGGIAPVGSITINQNGVYDVKMFETAVVNIIPQVVGSLNISENGIYNVSEKSMVIVNVEQEHEDTDVVVMKMQLVPTEGMSLDFVIPLNLLLNDFHITSDMSISIS